MRLFERDFFYIKRSLYNVRIQNVKDYFVSVNPLYIFLTITDIRDYFKQIILNLLFQKKKKIFFLASIKNEHNI